MLFPIKLKLKRHKKPVILLLLVLVLVMGIAIKKYYTQTEKPQFPVVTVQTTKVVQQDFALEVRAIGTLTAAHTIEITSATAGHVANVLVHDGVLVQAGTPLIQLDDAINRAQYESARANLAYSEMDYKRKVLLGKNGAIAKQAIDQAEADLKEKKALADEKAVILKKMQLTAPFAGVVGKSKINPGDYVNVGEDLLSLTDVQHLRVEFNVSEKYLPQIHLGQEVRITAGTYPGQVFIGTISYISPTINVTDRTISLYADINHDERLLKPGMFVNVTQALGIEHHVIVVPARSIVATLGGTQVYTVVAGKARAVAVEIGQRTAESVQVLSGLHVGDVVVTDGQLKLKDGMPVKVL